jgi:ribonuclease E
LAADDEHAGEHPDRVQPDRGERDETRGESERRRRRGRRGGRRNRQRNGDAAHGENDRGPRPEQTFAAPGDDLIAPPATEPDLKAAVADLDAAPMPRAPIRAEVTSPSAPEAEPPRRRSTVRERAPISGGADAPPTVPIPTAAPVPEPVITEVTEAADGDRPRKTGWWSRRFAGG